MDVSVMERFYSKIFTTPKKRYSVALGILTIAFTSILNGISSKAFFVQRYFFLGLFIIFATAVLSRYIKLAFNERRVFFLALLILISIETFDIIVIHAGLPNLIIIAPASTASLLTTTFYFTSESDEKKVCFATLLMLIFFYPVNYIYSFNAPHRFLAYFISSVVGISIGYLYIKYLDKNYGFNVKEFLKAFLLFWLTTNPKYFEKKLEEIGVIKKGWIRCLKIGDVKLISTSFHPGPIRNIGGAKIVEMILKKNKTMFLHSATTHKNNLVSLEEVKKVVSQIECNGKKINPKEPYVVTGINYNLIVFPFNDFKLAIVSGKNAIDDLPDDIQRFAEKFGDVLIIDAHNSFKKEFEVNEKEIEEIKKLIERAMGKNTNPSSLKYSFFKERVESKNICGYVALLLLKYDNGNYSILMIDSNNIKKEFRNDIERFLEENGYFPVVISTDNHSKTGVSPKIGYKPAGDDITDVKAIFEFLNSKIKSPTFKDAEVQYNKKEVDAKVMGAKFFEDIEKAFLQFGQKALYLFIFIVLIQAFVSIFLGLTIL